MIRRAITDRDCLRAARRVLADHLATRPATTTEAASIARAHHAEAANMIAAAELLEARRPPTAYEIGRGPDAPRKQHAASIACALDRQEAGRIRQQALTPTMWAEAWTRIQADPRSAWEQTRVERAARVAFYAARVGAQDSATPPIPTTTEI